MCGGTSKAAGKKTFEISCGHQSRRITQSFGLGVARCCVAEGADDLFTIQGSPGHYFYGGQLPGNRQALVAQCIDGYVLVAVFDTAGTLQEVVRRDLPPSLLVDRGVAGYDVDEKALLTYLGRELGFVTGPIHIKAFRVAGERFAAYRLPHHYQEFLADPASPVFGDEEREVFPVWIARWLQEGAFVVEWGNDFWMDCHGQVTSS
jgi:hypothetical protein